MQSNDNSLISRLHTETQLVVLTGAGVSAESGIPTFRDPDPSEGLWAQFDPQELASPEGFRRNPKLVFQWYAWRRAKVLAALPNEAHRTLARWESVFPNMTLITQNVDGLHTRAGSSKVIEMHGSIHSLRCFQNDHPGSWDDVLLDQNQCFDTLEPLACRECGSWMRPGVVWFGESLANSDMRRIYRALNDCEVFLAIGTSGLVYPAAGFLAEAKRKGAFTGVINPDASAKGVADLFIQGKAAEVLPPLDMAIVERNL